MKIPFTIVVPACNVAGYAAEMIASVKAQTFPEFEAIIVNEESKDGTRQVLHEAIAGDGRFELVTLPRSGSASVSRNYGIDHAGGEYIVFLDGDDWLEPEALARFDRLIREADHPDIVMAAVRCWYCRADGVWEPRECLGLGREGERFASGVDAMLADGKLEHWIPGSWLNIFRTGLLRENRLYQVPGRMHQDDEWTYRVFLVAGKTAATEYSHYNYRCNEQSITNTQSRKSIADRAANAESVLQYWRTHDIPARIKRPLADYYCKNFLHHSFFTRSRLGRLNPNRPSCAERREMFRRCFGPSERFAAYLAVARAAKRSERLMIPVMRLARCRYGFKPADLFFNFIYYPAIFVFWRKLKNAGWLHRKAPDAK